MKDGGKVKKDNDVSDMVKPGPSRFFDSDKKKAAKEKADKKNQERINKQRKEVAKNPNKISDMIAKTREDLKKRPFKKGGMACGGKTKKYAKGGSVTRGDGACMKGHTKGKMV